MITAVDFETANYARVSACAIGLVVIDGRTIVEKRHHYIRPIGGHLPFHSTIHGITEEHTNNAPLFAELYPTLRQYLCSNLVGYTKFDSQVLRALFRECGIDATFAYEDVAELAKTKLSNLSNHKLQTVAAYLRVPLLKHHDALEDAEACARIYLALTSHDPLPQSNPVAAISAAFTSQHMAGNEMYTPVNLDQQTPEWHAWRSNGIGASDAPTIMGENPFRSIKRLMQEKLGRIRSDWQNARMATGNALEHVAREFHSAQTGLPFLPLCVQSVVHPWMHASLDGISPDGTRVVEIKCGKSAFRETRESGAPPDYYYGQLQHILAVTGLTRIDFVCFFPPYEPLCVPVSRDEDYIRRLLVAEQAFWQQVQRVRAG